MNKMQENGESVKLSILTLKKCVRLDCDEFIDAMTLIFIKIYKANKRNKKLALCSKFICRLFEQIVKDGERPKEKALLQKEHVVRVLNHFLYFHKQAYFSKYSFAKNRAAVFISKFLN